MKMTIEIKTNSGYFDGDSFDEILKDIVYSAEQENDFFINIECIQWNDFTLNHLISRKQLLFEAKEENRIANARLYNMRGCTTSL